MGSFNEHPELRALRNLGVPDDQVQKFQVLCLPENLAAASSKEELIDASGTADLAKRLKEVGVQCATSYDLTPEAKTIDRRGADLWLGVVWVLTYVALPFCIDVLANMVTSRRQPHIQGGRASGARQKVHLKLRIKRGEEVAEIDYSGDGETLSRMLEGLRAGTEKLE